MDLGEVGGSFRRPERSKSAVQGLIQASKDWTLTTGSARRTMSAWADPASVHLEMTLPMRAVLFPNLPQLAISRFAYRAA